VLADRRLAVSERAAAPVIDPVSAIARTIRRLCTSRSAAASVIDTSSHGMHVIGMMP
jgi:hypothetical protein